MAKLTQERIKDWLASTGPRRQPCIGSPDLRELLIAASWALNLGYAGSAKEQARVDRFQADLRRHRVSPLSVIP